MEDKGHLIRRTTLDLSINNGSLEEAFSEKYKDFFVSKLIPILEEELSNFKSKGIIQIDSWEFDLGNVNLTNSSELSEDVFRGLEKTFRKEIKKKLKSLGQEIEEGQSSIEIIKDFLLHGKSDHDHFLSKNELSNFYSKLSISEQKDFIRFIKNNRGNQQFVKRITSQLSLSEIEMIFEALSNKYVKFRDIIAILFRTNGLILSSTIEDSYLGLIQSFWAKEWSLKNDKLLESIKWGQVFNKEFFESIPLSSESPTNRILTEVSTMLYTALGNDSKHQVSIEKTEIFNDVHLKAVEDEEKGFQLLKYFLINGSFPIDERQISIQELNAILLNLDSKEWMKLRTLWPKKSYHGLWYLVDQLSLNETTKVVKIFFDKKFDDIIELSDLVQSAFKYGFLETDIEINDKLTLQILWQIFSTQKPFKIKFNLVFLEILSDFGITVNVEKKRLFNLQSNKPGDELQKLVTLFIDILTANRLEILEIRGATEKGSDIKFDEINSDNSTSDVKGSMSLTSLSPNSDSKVAKIIDIDVESADNDFYNSIINNVNSNDTASELNDREKMGSVQAQVINSDYELENNVPGGEEVEGRDIEFSQAFIIDFLRFFVHENQLPWWANDLNSIQNNFSYKIGNSIDEIVLVFAKKYLMSEGDKARLEFKAWLSNADVLSNILFQIPQSLKRFLLKEMLPIHKGLSFVVFMDHLMEVGKIQTSNQIYLNDLTDEVLFLLSDRILKFKSTEVKESFELILRSFSEIFDIPYSELINSALLTGEEVSQIPKDLIEVNNFLLNQLKSEEEAKVIFEDESGETQIELQKLLHVLKLGHQDLIDVLLKFIQFGRLDVDISQNRFLSLLKSQEILEDDKIADLLKEGRVLNLIGKISQVDKVNVSAVILPNKTE